MSISTGSRPAFSDNVLGIISRLSAKASIASCSLPGYFGASFLIMLASAISVAPPPGTYFMSLMSEIMFIIASLSALSASSSCLSSPALRRTETAFGFLQSCTNTILSSPIFLSSTRPAYPRSFSDRSSKSVTILAPVALASFSISEALTLLTARIPAFARKNCAMSSIPFWQNTTFAPTLTTLSTISFNILVSSSRNSFILSGSLILISALNSVFSISNGALIKAIFAFVTRFGMAG